MAQIDLVINECTAEIIKCTAAIKECSVVIHDLSTSIRAMVGNPRFYDIMPEPKLIKNKPISCNTSPADHIKGMEIP